MGGSGINATIERFGHPGTLVAEYRHWVVLLRPAQPTLGSLVLAAKGDATAFSALSADAFAELGQATVDIEATLTAVVGYEKINYLMLMMVDPHVHFHVIPRYAGSRAAHGITIEDAGWPATPALGQATSLDDTQVAALRDWLRNRWPASAR